MTAINTPTVKNGLRFNFFFFSFLFYISTHIFHKLIIKSGVHSLPRIILADGDRLSWTSFNLLHSWTSGVLEASGTFNLKLSLRPACFIRRVEYEMAHCVLLEHTHLSHVQLNQTKGDASIDPVAGRSLPRQRFWSSALFEKGLFP